MKKITVIIPCYNEEHGIGRVIDKFPRKALREHGYELDVLVVDNNSKDRTSEVALAHGARVIHEPKQGKGNAIRAGFYSIGDDTDYVVMLDGDDTYKSEEILRLVEPLKCEFADVIIGSRLGGRIRAGSMKGFNRFGNWFFSLLVRSVYKVSVTDVLTGYFAWRRETIYKLRPHLVSKGFAIEMEMITKMARLKQEIFSVPISYDPRQGESSLHPVKDGLRILAMFIRQIKWRPQDKKIVFVSDTVYPFFTGGKEQRLYEITKRLVRDGREVHVYTMQWWKGAKEMQFEGVHFHAITRLRPIYVNEKRSVSEAVMFGLACFKMLFVKFDVIDVDHMPVFPLISMRIVCWLRFKKLHATWHEVWGAEYWKEYLGATGFIGAWMEKVSFKLPDVIISNSAHTTERLKLAGVRKDVTTIPLGVDLDSIIKAPISKRTSDVMYAGRLMAHKNVDLLIKAVAIAKHDFPKIRCLIVGTGPERKRLDLLVTGLGLRRNVKIIDFYEHQADLFAAMKASRVFVLPSVREGFGLVALEAIACGLPVVTTNHAQNASKDIITEGEDGLIVEPDAGEIAHAMMRVLGSQGAWLSQTLMRKADQFSWERVAERMEEAFLTA